MVTIADLVRLGEINLMTEHALRWVGEAKKGSDDSDRDARDTVVVRIALSAVEYVLDSKRVHLDPEDIAMIEGRIVEKLISMK